MASVKSILLFTSLLLPGVALAADEKFVEHNLESTLWHEVGHALINEFDLPVLGQEEDTADTYANLEMIRRHGALAREMLSNVADAWMIEHKKTSGNLSFNDEHDLDAQRAFRTICTLYGDDPKSNASAARRLNFSSEELENCENITAMNRKSWEGALAGLLRVEGDAVAVPRIKISHAAGFETEAAFLETTGVLRRVADTAVAAYAWPRPLRWQALPCGQSNAFYETETNTIQLCYEMVRELAGYAERR